MYWFIAVQLFIISQVNAAKLVENGVVGEPRVECLSDNIRVSFDTDREFEGHVYVKGHYSRGECRVDATLRNNVSLTVPFTACDMRRQRSNNPKGVHISVPVIITFHPMFITKIDKSYMVQCFYHEVDKTVTTQLDVSFGRNQEKKIIVMIGDATPATSELQNAPTANNRSGMAYDEFGGLQTEVITVQMPLPVCKYQVLSGGPQGEPVKFVSVGQVVYHQWSCTAPDGSSGDEGFYCATIHSCVVEEDGGREVQLLDENGCAVDKYLLDNLQYTSDLTGGQISQVFKFADQSSLFFHCQIRLSIKDGKCKRTSDHCPTAPKAKRSVSAASNDLSNVDVFSQSMTVFDIDDPISKKSLFNLQNGTADGTEAQSNVTCVSKLTFKLLLSLLSFISMICFFVISFVCLKQLSTPKATIYSHRI